jgi:hypothetical protein
MIIHARKMFRQCSVGENPGGNGWNLRRDFFAGGFVWIFRAGSAAGGEFGVVHFDDDAEADIEDLLPRFVAAARR